MTVRTISFVFPVMAILGMISLSRQGDILIPAVESGKWGYINRAGQWRIPPRFDEVTLFSEGLAGFREMKYWGFIDASGKERIAAQHSAVGNFRGGFAPVRKDRKWGFVDTSGKFIVQPQFQTASDFFDGMARVEFWDSVCGMSNDEAPEELFDRRYTSYSVIWGHECGGVNSRIGYVHRDGVLAISPQYADGSDFSEGLAVVADKDSGLKGYIDSNGKVVLPFVYAVADPFSEGLASVRLRGETNTVFIDRAGRKVIDNGFSLVRSFSEGLAPFQRIMPDGIGWSYMDRNGTRAIRTDFTQAFPFSEGLAVVWLGSADNQGYIDKTGRIAFRVAVGAKAMPIKDGIAVVKLRDGQLQYLDKTGTPILPRRER